MQMIDSWQDDATWDRVIDLTLQFGAALLLGALFFLDIIVMDVSWQKAMLVSWIVIGCATFKLGVWTLRKVALAFTLYAAGYLIGALPNVGTVGAFFTRMLT
jgi:hypothetical protein